MTISYLDLTLVEVIAAQIWLRTISFIVWLAVACPCCRLERADNVFDAFERELGIPLLQCSFLAFACTMAGMILDSKMSSMQRMAVGFVATYYTAFLLIWTAPAVLQAKVMAEERLSARFGGTPFLPIPFLAFSGTFSFPRSNRSGNPVLPRHEFLLCHGGGYQPPAGGVGRCGAGGAPQQL